MCLAREEFVHAHPIRKISNNKGYSGYVPSKLPAKITKDNLKSAFNEYFARFVKGEEKADFYAIEVVKMIKKEVNSGHWNKFEYTTDENGCGGLGYRAEIRISATEINFTIKIRNRIRILIKDASFDPGKSEKLQRYKIFWFDIVNA